MLAPDGRLLVLPILPVLEHQVDGALAADITRSAHRGVLRLCHSAQNSIGPRVFATASERRGLPPNRSSQVRYDAYRPIYLLRGSVRMLTNEMKRQVFLKLRTENYRASLRLEGLVQRTVGAKQAAVAPTTATLKTKHVG